MYMQSRTNLKLIFLVLHRMHLVSFYFSSVYYDISKRITGIQYVRIVFIIYMIE